MNDKLTTMICGCCTAPIAQIPADWATARRIRSGAVKVQRVPTDRCDECLHHDVYRAPCVPADFTEPCCVCGCVEVEQAVAA